MAFEHSFSFPLPNGLHARPASHLQELANRFASEISLTNQRNRRTANVKSVLSMVSADIGHNDPCVFKISGADEAAAGAELIRFLRDEFPSVDDAMPEVSAEQAELLLPRSLKAAGLREFHRGVAVSAGIGWGRAVLLQGPTLPEDLEKQQPQDVNTERMLFAGALAAARKIVDSKISASTHAREIEVLRAHLAILNDVSFIDKVVDLIDHQHKTAAQAVFAATQFFSDTLEKSTSSYLRERVLDLQDVCKQLLDALGGANGGTNGSANDGMPWDRPTICIADRLTPGRFLALDRRHLRGLVLREGGTTSHTVILARSMNIPTLVDVGPDVLTRLSAGQEVIVDANLGILVPQVTEPLRRYYQLETRRLEMMHERLASPGAMPAVTSDGLDLEVAANVTSAEEVVAAIDNGAHGIGLFRTEMLFMDRKSPPSEDEQFEVYTAAARAADGLPVMIRLLDIGGDKPAPYLNFPDEANPFLGYRGARIYAENSELIKTQLRAILRASTDGELRILIPMVCCIEEVRIVRRLLEQVKDELTTSGARFKRGIQLGAMIEVPSSAFLIQELAEETDFFSIGSNDLAQYFLAADRDNRKVSHIYGWSHPAFLRLLQQIVDEAHEAGKWIGLCGEMADCITALPILIGLGLDEISLAAPRIPAVKQAVAAQQFERCRDLLEQAMSCATRAQVEAILEDFGPSVRELPLLARDLLLLDCQATSKAEAIKEMCDALWLAGRVQRPQLVEESVWQREDAYSTGFGFGFALPHCKSEHVGVNSIVLCKLANPVAWGSTDKQPVDVVILLAIRAAEYERDHMRIFAQLSRLVMREDFRSQIRELDDPARLLSFLQGSLGLSAMAFV